MPQIGNKDAIYIDVIHVFAFFTYASELNLTYYIILQC